MRPSSAGSRSRGAQATSEPIAPASMRRRGPAGIAGVPRRSAVSAERRLDVGPHATWRTAPRPRRRRAVRRPAAARRPPAARRTRPEVVPVVLVDRAEVLGRRPGREQPHERPVGGRARRARPAARTAPLAVDPVGAAGDRLDDALDERRVAGEPPVAAQRHERGAVAVPLVVLAEEEPVGPLPPRIRGQHLGDLVVVAVPVECVEQVGGVAEPEAVVGRRPRGDLVAVVEQQQEAPVGVDRLRQPVVGQHESHAPVALRPPPGRHRRRRRKRLGERRCGHQPPVGRGRAGAPASRARAGWRPGTWRRGRAGTRTPPAPAPPGRGPAPRQRSPAPPPKHGGRRVAVVERRGRDRAGAGVGSSSATRPSTATAEPAQVDALDDGQALGVVGPHGEGERRPGRGDAFSISTTTSSPPPSALLRRTAYTRWTASPDGMLMAVSTTGVASTRRWRTATSRDGTCQRSSAPIHQSSDQPSYQGVTSPPGSTIASRGESRLPTAVQFRCVTLVRNGRWPRGTNDGELGSICRSSQYGHTQSAPICAAARVRSARTTVLRPDRHEVGGHARPRRRLAEALERRQVADGVVGDAQAAHRPAQHPACAPPRSLAHPVRARTRWPRRSEAAVGVLGAAALVDHGVDLLGDRHVDPVLLGHLDHDPRRLDRPRRPCSSRRRSRRSSGPCRAARRRSGCGSGARCTWPRGRPSRPGRRT